MFSLLQRRIVASGIRGRVSDPRARQGRPESFFHTMHERGAPLNSLETYLYGETRCL